MDVRKLLVVLLVGLVLLPVCAGATTYKLPIKATASIAMDASDYPADWVEDVEYDFYANPSSLKVGYDSGTNKVYDSALYLDWNDLSFIPVGTPLTVTFCWSLITPPSGNPVLFQGFGAADPLGPQPCDFDWWGLSYWVGLNPLDQPSHTPSINWYWPRPGCPPQGILLLGYQQTTLTEIAGVGNGLGYEAPYVLISTVPEPSTWLALVLPLLGLGLAACKKRIAGGVVLACVLALAVSPVFADDTVGSEPGEVIAPSGMCFAQSAITLPYDDGFVILPTFPRLFYSYGCVPTVASMMTLYYKNSGFINMYDQPFSPGNSPNDNGPFLKTYPDGSKDPDDMYPSRCAISATEKGVLGRIDNGHVDDYW